MNKSAPTQDKKTGKKPGHQKTTVNKEAKDVIRTTIKRKENAKLKLLAACLGKIEKVCREHGISWFCMGKLLSLCSSGRDDYIDEFEYDIGLMRKDYDDFLTQWKKLEDRSGLTLEEIYTARGVVKQNTAYIRNRRKVTVGDETFDLELRVNLQPFDIYPSDKKERDDWIMQVSKKAGELNRLCMHYRFMRQDSEADTKSPMRLPRLVKDKLVTGTRLRKVGREYRRLIAKYSGMEHPVHVGRVDHQVYRSLLYEDIFPLAETSWKDIPVMLPARTDKLSALPPEEEKKRILSGRLSALSVFDSLCADHDLSYVPVTDLAVICSHPEREIPEESLWNDWVVGMMREDYNRMLSLLEDNEDDIIMFRSEPLYTSVCGEKIRFYKKGYGRYYPRQNDGYISLVPFDRLPSAYKDRRPFAEDIKKITEDLNIIKRYEKGFDYKNPGISEDSWSLFEILQDKRAGYNHAEEENGRIFTLLIARFLVMPYNEIFPSGKTELAGQTISRPANPYYWFVKEDPDYTEYLAARRERVMKIMDEMAMEHGIRYFAMSNLVKGTVIYHDVMPFSDQQNIEIGLLRDDYEAYVSLLRERGADYGVSLVEYLDEEGEYPIRVKYITEKGYEYSQARVRIGPFDRIPEDYYLYQGLRDELDPLNEDYKILIQYYDPDEPLRACLPDNLSPSKRKELEKTRPADLAARIEKLAGSFNDDDRFSTYKWIAFGISKGITSDELFPLQRVKFRGIEISCPKDASVWQPVLDSELERQVSCIQKADLILLEEFDRVCREVGVGYFICGGTMLGYMRHQGFIPWDDDVDCAMLRADYDKFIREAGSHLKEGFFLQTRQSDPNIPYLFCKIRLDDTEYITRYNKERNFHKGICLDIFPFDYLPENLNERKEFVEEVRELARKHHIIARRQYPIEKTDIEPLNEQQRRYVKEQKERLKNYWKKDLARSQADYLKAATRYNSQAEELQLRTVGSFVPTYTFIDLNDLLPYQRGTFENIEVSVPKRPDIFLEMQYGDYMQLPPRHMQVAHRLLRWATWEDRGEAAGGKQKGFV